MADQQLTELNPYRALIRRMFLAAVFMNAAAAAAWIGGQQFAGLCLALFALCISIVIVIFRFAGRKAARKIILLLNGDGVLARWEYPDNIFQRYIDAEFARQRSNANILLIVFLIAGPVVGIAEGGMNGIWIGIGLGVALGAFAYSLGYGLAAEFRKRGMTPPHEAYLSQSSVYLNGMFVDWNSMGSRLVSAEIKKDDGTGMPSIFIIYTVRDRYGEQFKELYVPIPDGKIHEAQKIITQLQ
ncbi:MAG: hypothetical protein ACOYNS_15700 [Bacteroidota bacterium]